MNAFRRATSRLLLGVAGMVFTGAGAWGLFLLLPPVYRWMSTYIGFLAAPAILVVAPIVGSLGPLYAGLVHGWWQPAMVLFGGFAISAVTYGIATHLSAAKDD